MARRFRPNAAPNVDDGDCLLYCPDDCWSFPDVETCAPGERACVRELQPEQVYVCDRSCAPAGGCRRCIDDADCESELGIGATCQRHCGYCCNETGDPPVRCVCI